MKKISTIILLCFCLYSMNGQNNDIVIGKIDSLNSNILNEQRKIWVYTPEDNSDGIFGKKNYPVVYLLDGEAHFYSVVGMIRQLSAANGNRILPKMIVVGIPNTNRIRDLTPTKGIAWPGMMSTSWIEDTGGGKNFMSFIEKELIPYVNSNYPTQPYKMLIGHSFGGLTVMNTLVHKPNLFNSYVSIDPSMWWSEGKLLNEIKQITFDEKYRDKTLFLGIANTMSEGMDISNVQKDTTRQSERIRYILEINTILNKETQKNISFKGKYYGEDDHDSVPLIAEYDAFRFLFDFYRFKTEKQDFLDPESDLFPRILNHYKKLSKGFNMEMKPDQEYINKLGYLFIRLKQFKRSEEFFKLNVTNYPGSFNAYTSLGDFYVANGEKEKAVENYKKSISLNKDSSSKEKLIALEKE